MSDVNHYAYWQAKLAGQDPEAPESPAERTIMPCGFWRLRSGKPLAVWMDGERRVAQVGFADDCREAATGWMERTAESGSFGEAMPEEVWRAAFEAGRWADDPPPMGHNNPPDQEPWQAAAATLEDQRGQAEVFIAAGPIASKQDADKCASWARQVGLLSKEADETRVVEKKPHLEAAREVDDRWMPIVKGAAELAKRLKKHLEPWLLAQDKAAEEARAAELAKANELREAADRSLTEAGREGAIAEAEQIEKAAAEKPKSIAGRPNMRVSLRTETVAKIVDYDKALIALKDNPEVKALVEKIASQIIKAGGTLDGVEADTQKKAA